MSLAHRSPEPQLLCLTCSSEPLPAVALLPAGPVLSESLGAGTVSLPHQLPRRREGVPASGPLHHQQRGLPQQLHHVYLPEARPGEHHPRPGPPHWDPGESWAFWGGGLYGLICNVGRTSSQEVAAGTVALVGAGFSRAMALPSAPARGPVHLLV